MRSFGTLGTFLSALFFPWPLTVFLAIGMSIFEPWVPLAVGLFIDTLYYVPQGVHIPFFTLGGALVSALSFFVRSRLKTSSIEG